MNVEENRLQTFADWPANAEVNAARIAKAGFYYSGRAVEVQCFLCGVIISDWKFGDQAMVRHREAAPDCPFVQNSSNTCNVPLIPVSTNNSALASTSTEVQQECNSSNNESPTHLQNEDSLEEYRTLLELASTPTEVQQGNDSIKQRSISYLENKDPLKEYRTLSQRLQTFSNWPIPLVLSPERIAMSGFYYLQHDDMVQCAYCGSIVWKWEPGNDLDQDTEYKVHFPDCDFYTHRDKDDILYLNNVKLKPGTTSSLAELGIHIHMASKKPNYATYEKRLRTFYGWPENLVQTPELLSSAGFYYTDVVRCFHCDIGLRKWEASDDVWVEHARWFPKCEFVNLIRGQEFIKHCIDNRRPLNPSIFEGVAEDEDPDTAEAPPPLALSTNLPSPQDNMVERLSDTPLEKHASEISLHTQRIKTTTNENKNEIILNKEEEPEVSNNESDENKIKIKLKEIASLKEENRKLKEARLCKICIDREVAIVFLPCGHLTCIYCAPSLTYCPMCRREIRATVRAFLS
ncbi:death-associated inhibitor of apoptosis 2 isoform X2 [Colletes latitarsis]|uniref:death-associated inhibitor of apoptosis 2 isoform X2 n=1 Tax=Colletes latitarsis TaxID=2605962 RepID=UPI0040353E0D